MPRCWSRCRRLSDILVFLLLFHVPSSMAESHAGLPGALSMAVGGVTATSARFRVHSATPDTVNIEVSTNTLFSPSIVGNPVKADTGRYNTVLIDVAGLQADQLYYYRAWIAGIPQPKVQSFQTFPVEGIPATFTFAFGSCQQSGSLLPSAYQGKVFYAVAKSGASLFLQLGDWGYPDSVDNPPADNDFFSADYRLVQQSYLAKFDPLYPMDTVLSIMPVDYVYDDHDFMNNNASATTSSYFEVNQNGTGVTVLELPNPPGARENSIRGYLENMPTYPVTNESRGIYHKFTVGNAEFFMLDLRSQRSPNLESFSTNPSTGKWEYHVPPGHSLLASPSAPGSGPTQLAWLLEALKSSTAKWKFLVSSVPFNKAQAIAIQLGVLLQDSVANGIPGIASGTPALFAALEFADKWVGFPTDLDTVLSTIRQNNIQNVIVLSADSHTAAMDDGTNAGLPEIMAGCLDIKNSEMVAAFAKLGLNIWNEGGQGLTTDLFNNAFGKVTVYGADSVTLQLVDENGTVFASHTIRDAQTGVTTRQPVPTGFELFQNYPNPFNPLTIIKYTVGGVWGDGVGNRDVGGGDWGLGASNTKLVVYDMLGSEVAVLVDERKTPGDYEVDFNASNLSSGVYFYRLTAGNFVQTRKMLFVK
jgi:phosphodiesterase/alkaline phosphatase D-like protein